MNNYLDLLNFKQQLSFVSECVLQSETCKAEFARFLVKLQQIKNNENIQVSEPLIDLEHFGFQSVS